MPLNYLQGTVNAESYISVSEADSLLGVDLDWISLDSLTKENALKLATQLVDSLFFYGKKLIPNQALEFPRDYFKYIQVTPSSIFQGSSTSIVNSVPAGARTITETLNPIVRRGGVEISVTLLLEGVPAAVVLRDDGPPSNPFYNPIYVASSSLDYGSGDLSVTFNYEIDSSENYMITYRYHDTVQYDSFSSADVSESSIDDYKIYEENAALVVCDGVNSGVGEAVKKLDIYNSIVVTDPFSIEIGSDDSFYLIAQLPVNIRLATAKQAAYFTKNSTTMDLVKRYAGIIQYKIGDVFASYSSDPVSVKNLFYPDAFFYLNEYLGKKTLRIGRA